MAATMAWRSANPTIEADTFSGVPAAFDAGVMTIGGTVNKTALSLVMLLISAGYVWNRGAADPGIGAFIMAGALGGFVLALVTVFKHAWAPYTTPIYAALEGLALGGISVIFEATYPGIVSQAVFLTFGTLGALLIAWCSRVGLGSY